MQSQPYQQKAWLHRQYHTLGRSTVQIARACGVGKTTILSWMRKHDIPRRENKVRGRRKKKDYQKKDWLYQKYMVEKLRPTEIAKASRHNANRKQIEYWLKKHGLWGTAEPRDYESEAWLRQKYYMEDLSTTEIAEQSEFDVSAWTIRNQMDRFSMARREHQGRGEKPYHEREWLEEHYRRKRMSLSECGKAVNPPVGAEAIRGWLDFHGIRRRPAVSLGRKRGFKCTEETCRKISELKKGTKTSEKTKRKISAIMKGRKITWGDKISKGLKKVRHGYGKRPAQPKGYWIECSNGETVYMRSGWEVCFAAWLDKNGYTWKYEPRTFTLAEGDGYTPDFYVKELETYFEVKGWMRDWAQDKIDRFQRMYPEIELVIADKKYLNGIGCDLSLEVDRADKPKVTCPVCGKLFPKRKENQKCCSTKCGHRLRSQTASAANAKVLSLIEKLRGKDFTAREIADNLNKAGHRTPRGRKWTMGNVQLLWWKWRNSNPER